MILGIDLGNFNTKTNIGLKFKSTIKPGITRINKNDIQVIYNNQEFTIGAHDGAKNIGKNKYSKLHFKLCLLTAIVKSVNENKNIINCKVVLGVPVEDFNNKQLIQEIKNNIMSWGQQKITVNKTEKNILIQDVDVFCESGLVWLNKAKFKTETTLIIDIGGSTIDISLWDGLRLRKSKTYKNGMITLYEKIISTVNQRERVSLNANFAINMIGKDTFTISQKDTAISYINSDIENYILELISYINQYFDIDECNSIQLIGGGSIILNKWLTNEFINGELVEKAEFANANTFYSIGKQIWS